MKLIFKFDHDLYVIAKNTKLQTYQQEKPCEAESFDNYNVSIGNDREKNRKAKYVHRTEEATNILFNISWSLFGGKAFS